MSSQRGSVHLFCSSCESEVLAYKAGVALFSMSTSKPKTKSGCFINPCRRALPRLDTSFPRHRACTRNPTLARARQPRYEKKRHPLASMRVPGPVSQDRLKFWHLPSDLELFVIRRLQTTDGETHIVTMDNAGDRPPRYDKKRHPLTVGRGPVPRHRSRSGKNVSGSLQVRRP